MPTTPTEQPNESWTATENDLGRMAQAFFEECRDILNMNMTDKERIVQGLRLALRRVQNTDLEGAGEPVAEGERVQTVAEFAAHWNSISEVNRVKLLRQLIRDRDDANRCFMQDHSALLPQLEASQRRFATLIEGLEDQDYYKAKPHKALDALLKVLDAISPAQPKATRKRDARAGEWNTEYRHTDCAICEDLAELAIMYVGQDLDIQTRNVAVGDHWGRATRVS